MRCELASPGRTGAASTPVVRVLVLTTLTMALLSMSTAKPFIEEDFENPQGWKKQVRGEAAVSLVPQGVEGKALHVQADGGLAYYTRELPLNRVRGRTISIRSKVKLDNVRVGDQVFCTAKLHIAVRADGRTRHHATRFTGTADWHDQYLSVEVPKNADLVVLDLGIQNGHGAAWYDQLVVDDGVREHRILSIDRMANTTMEDPDPARGRGGFIDAGALDLAGFPRMYVRFGDTDFKVLSPQANYGLTCIVLQGRERPGLPRTMHTMIPVRARGSRLFFLHASAWADPEAREPCLVYDVAYEDGTHEEIVMREGVDIGSFQDPAELPNWRPVWSVDRDGVTVGVGVSQWLNPRPDTVISWIRPRSTGRQGVPIILAVSLDPRPLPGTP